MTAQSSFHTRNQLWNMALTRCYGGAERAGISYMATLPASTYVEMIWQGQAESDDSPLCAADALWYLRVLRREGRTTLTIHGPTTSATLIDYRQGDEFIGIRFKPGVFFSCLSLDRLVNGGVTLPNTSRHRFWLQGTAWELPNYANALPFVERLIGSGLLMREKAVVAVLSGQPQTLSLRSMQLRFRHATGLTCKMIQQIERARSAAARLTQGVSILDTLYGTGYTDQAHMTRSLNRFIGQTPARIMHPNSFV